MTFFVVCSHFIHIYVHSLERQFLCYLFTFLNIHLKSNFMLYTHAYIHSFERKFLCYLFTFLKGNFMSYIHILRSIFLLYSTYVRFISKVFAYWYLFYVYMYMVKNISTPSKCKEIIMMQPKPSAGLKGKPHQHALIFMPSCIQNQKAWVPRPKSHFGTCFSSYETVHTLKMAITCTNSFHRLSFTK